MSTTLVRGGTLVTGAGRRAGDVFIDEGVIVEIGPGLTRPADVTVDATGLIVMPGGIDAHTHLDMPLGDITSTDDFETGTIAAAHGGTTMIVDFATQEAAGQGLYPALDAWMRRAEGRAVVDYAFHMIVRDLNEQAAIDMDCLTRRDGVTSFKLFMAYPGVLMVDDATILRALTLARESGALVSVHAEMGAEIDRLVRDALRQGQTAPKHHALTRPPRVEGEAAGRAIALAGQAGAPIYIVHVSSADALEQVQRARERGMPVFGETCPQYLCLSAADYEREGFEGAKYVCSPPLRDAWHQERLWAGLAKDDLQVVATDHCPFGMWHPPHKLRGRDGFSKIPNGMPGIESRLMLLWDGGVGTGRIGMERFVELVAENPARIFGLWPKKGALAVGSDGDLVVWDPGRRVTLSAASHHMRVDYSPYEGRTVVGAPAAVLSRGDVIVEHGIFTGRPGRGRFIKRAPGPPPGLPVRSDP